MQRVLGMDRVRDVDASPHVALLAGRFGFAKAPDPRADVDEHAQTDPRW